MTTKIQFLFRSSCTIFRWSFGLGLWCNLYYCILFLEWKWTRQKSKLENYFLTWNSPLESVNLGRCVNRSAILIKLPFPFERCSWSKMAFLIMKDRFSPKYSLLRRVTHRLSLTLTPSDALRQSREIPSA